MTNDRHDDPDDESAGSAPPALTEAARRVAAGEAVDWPEAESSATDPSLRVALKRLRSVESIASFHRRWQESGDEAPDSPVGQIWNDLNIIEEIGHGSFGRVYRAFDPRLDREVALKILDPGAVSDSSQGQSVIEEGRHLARLRHPNIVVIHAASRADGRVGLEMELIKGRTLAEIVRAQGPLGADESALVARDVCRALAAVHGAGLVHRDVKAQNVIREQGGRTVLMDLGAGRSISGPAPNEQIAGTPLYLAPEVLKGSPPTPQSDLYGLGVLLFFLATGSFPFEASDVSDLREAHERTRRKWLRDVRPDLPERFIQLVEHALAPDPAARFQSAGSFEDALSRTLGHVDEPAASGPVGTRWRGVAIGALTVAVVATAWAVWPRSTPARQVERFIVPLDGHLTIPSGAGSREFAISPDGSALVYATMATGRLGSHLLLRQQNDVEPRLIKDTGDAGQPFFSPAGTRIGFFSSSRIMAVPLAGGPPAMIAEATQGGASWGTQGIVFCRRPDLWRIADTGGEPVRLTTLDPATGDVAIRPQLLPTGDVLFTLRQSHGTTSSIAVVTRAGEIRVLVADATSAQYLAPGYLVFVAGAPPWIKVAPFDTSHLRLAGEPLPVEPVSPRTHWFDVSASGTLVFTVPEKPEPGEAPRLVWVDRETGQDQPIRAPIVPGQFLAYSLRLSPDGRRIAFTRPANPLLETVDQSDPGVLIVADLDRGVLGAPLLTEFVHPLAWSADGTRITYRKLNGSIAWRPVDGVGGEQLLATPDDGSYCKTGAWSPDGRTLLLGCGAPASSADGISEWRQVSFPSADVIGRTAGVMRTYLSTPGQGAPQFSKDGRWVALALNIPGEGRARVVVHGFPEPGIARPVSPAVGRRPLWRHDELIYLSPDPAVMELRMQPEFRVTPPKLLFDRVERFDTLNAGRLAFDASPDGRRILALAKASGRGGDYITGLTVVLNWADEVHRKISGR